jgi:hypothetical protein
MILVYVDVIMCISHYPKATIVHGIQATFKLKDNKRSLRITWERSYFNKLLMAKNAAT